ncbi:MAG: ABC transporter substrate-binding protein [Pseudomonadota bacterium]
MNNLIKKAFQLCCFLIIILIPFYIQADQNITIALVNNFSDFRSPCGDPKGENFLNALNLALEDFLKDHKKYSDQIILRKYDYGNSPLNTERITLEAVRSDAVALIGYPCSSFALLAAPIAEAHNVAMITPSATIDSLTESREYVYRASFRDEDQAKVMAEFLANDLDKKKAVVIVNQNYPYCTNLSEQFQHYFKKYGGKIVKVFNTLSSQKSYNKEVNEMNHLSYDVVFIPNHEMESATMVKEIYNLSMETTVAGGDGWGNLYGYIFPAIVGNKKIDAYAIAHWNRDSVDTSSKEFQKRYYNRFGFYPNDNSALAYDAMSLLLHAISKAKKINRKEINAELKSIRSHFGVTGRFSYNRGNGTPSKNVYIVKYPQPNLSHEGDRRFEHYKSVIVK